MELNWNFQRGGEGGRGGGGGGNSNQKAFCRRGINIFWNITLHLADNQCIFFNLPGWDLGS